MAVSSFVILVNGDGVEGATSAGDLGLSLEPTTEPVDARFVDQVERPSSNRPSRRRGRVMYGGVLRS